MNSKKWFTTCLIICMMILCCPVIAHAAQNGWVKVNAAGDMQYYSNGKLVKNKWVGTKHLNANGFMDRNKWIKTGSKRYYVNNSGNKVKGLVKIGKDYYYFDSKGVNKTGWKTVKGKKYYFYSKTRKALKSCVYTFKNKKAYCFNSKGVMQTGWIKVGDGWYYFKEDRKKGWLKLDGNTYYLIKAQNGKRAEGIFSVSGKLYYFDPDTGVMQKNTTVVYKDREYLVDANGVCTLVPQVNNPTSDMLFFLKFESGSEAYNQTGGDGGKACGAYQFDYRYALLPFIKFAYEEQPLACAPFKTFAAYKNTAENREKLKDNKKLYEAWHKIYENNPKIFTELQDTFAKINYYDNVERALESVGISIATRSEVVKGAIYSYSIQHGQGALGVKTAQCGAIGAVQAIKPNSSMTDKTFIEKLYARRIKSFPAYRARYESERDLALSLLNK